MALISCPECGKEISDKATACPNCGNPMNNRPIVTVTEEKAESYLCCPKCGSRELHAEHKGFSGGKALAGAILTGGIGLLACTIGSKDTKKREKCQNYLSFSDSCYGNRTEFVVVLFGELVVYLRIFS